MAQKKVKNNDNETLKAGCVIVENNRFLLVTDNHKTVWQFPKGHTEPGETPEETAIRETKEETGYTVKLIKKLPDVTYESGQTGEKVRMIIFQGEITGKRDKSEPQTNSRWFTESETKKKIYPNLLFLLEHLVK